MKAVPASVFLLAVAAAGVCALWCIAPLAAKPPPRKETPSPTPPPLTSQAAGEDETEMALARWLVQSDASPAGVRIGFSQLVLAATGRRVLPFEPTKPAMAAMLAKIGAALDTLLPRLNQPESSAHAAASLGDDAAVVARIDEELRNALGTATPEPAAAASPGAYPAVRLADDASGQSYYLGATLFLPGAHPEGAGLCIIPDTCARRMPADGCCLLVGIEQNGKRGKDLAFLNWEIVDLSRIKLRFTPAFRATTQDALPPSAVLTDGRKGRD
jgi:hypothetical protein